MARLMKVVSRKAIGVSDGVISYQEPGHRRGRPISTGSKGTPLVQFRVSASQYRDLKTLGLSKPPRTPNRVAKDIVVAVLARSRREA